MCVCVCVFVCVWAWARTCVERERERERERENASGKITGEKGRVGAGRKRGKLLGEDKSDVEVEAESE